MVEVDQIDASGDGESEPDIERRRFQVDDPHHGARLDRVLAARIDEFSRSYLQTLIEDGHVAVDGARVQNCARRVQAGQVIDIDLVPTPDSRAFRPEALPLRIVFEDSHLLVVDKAVGMVVHPAAGHWSGTLLNALLAHHPGAAQLARAGIVHRLDRDTSGLMVVGKTLVAVTALARSIAEREVRRVYLAICLGATHDALSLEQPIGRDPRSRVRMAVVANGKPARTDVERLGGSPRFSALCCRLHTGRTHQIRVHLAHAGHPLVGDAIYGGAPALGMSRQALHACHLGLRHPVSGTPLEFAAPPPQDFSSAWQQVTELSIGEALARAGRPVR